jgi:hypothetical protein
MPRPVPRPPTGRDVNLNVSQRASMPRAEITFFAILLYFSSRLAIWMGILYAGGWKPQNTKENKKKGKFYKF